MKQKQLKQLKYEKIKDRCYFNYVNKRLILWKTKEKKEVEMIMNIDKAKTIMTMILF